MKYDIDSADVTRVLDRTRLAIDARSFDISDSSFERKYGITRML